MFFLSAVEIQQDFGRGFLPGRTALRMRASRIGQKQRGQPIEQGLRVQIAPQRLQGMVLDGVEGDTNISWLAPQVEQEVQGMVLDGVEGDRPVDRPGMMGRFRIKVGLCCLGQH